MSHDAEVIAKAIESVRPSTDYVKDYIFPITMAFFSALLGGLSALAINRRQEVKSVIKDNFIAANQVFIAAEECLRALITIKSGYVDIDTDEPLLRAIRVGATAVRLEDVRYNASSLYFIRAIPTANKPFLESLIWTVKHRYLKRPVELPSPERLFKTWRNQVRIGAMFSNYNVVISTLRERNKINERIREPLSSFGEDNQPTIEGIYHKLGARTCNELVDITEAFLALSDHVIIELNDFLKEFPPIAESNIELSLITEWGRLPTYHNEQPKFKQCLEPVLKPNYAQLAAYVGLPEHDVRVIYTYKSWI